MPNVGPDPIHRRTEILTMRDKEAAADDKRPPISVPYTQVHGVLRHTMETVEDGTLIILMILLVTITLQALWRLLQMILWQKASPSLMLSQVVFVLILTDVYRTLIFYLREHRVSVTLMLEVAVVSILQNLIFNQGTSEYDWRRVLGSSVLLLVLGVLLAHERWAQRNSGEVSDSSAH